MTYSEKSQEEEAYAAGVLSALGAALDSSGAAGVSGGAAAAAATCGWLASGSGFACNCPKALWIPPGTAGVVGRWSPSGWKPFSSAMYLILKMNNGVENIGEWRIIYLKLICCPSGAV